MFIKYSTGQIPPKKSRGKGSQGKKTTDTHVANVDVSQESDPEPPKRKTASRRVVKKEVTISADDNIISDDPDVALEIVTESVPKPARRRKSGKVTSDPPKRLKGVPSLTLEEQEAGDTMQSLKESRKTSRRQPGTRGSNEGTGTILGVPDESTVVSATSSEGTGTKPGVPDKEKVISEEKVILEWGSEQEREYSKEDQLDDEERMIKIVMLMTKAAIISSTEFPLPSSSFSVSSGFGTQFFNSSFDISVTGVLKDTVDADVNSLMDIHIQQETPQMQSPSVQKVPVSVISKTTNLPPIPEILTETPVSTTVSSPHVTPTISTVQQTSTPIPTPPIITDAPTITTAIPESDALSAVQLRVAKLEKDVSELKKIDLFAKELKKHTVDLIQKYSLQQILELPKNQTPTVDLEQESEKSPSEILKIKKEQAEKQKMPKFTIKSTDKAALKEFDQKSALYQTMHANKSFNRNPANHRLYHALMEALIEDENAMDKGVADTVKDHKRKHDDDEDPPAGPNQGKKTKRRRTKESESSKKPSTTKETPKGKAPSKGSKTGKSASAKEPVEEPTAEVVMDDAGEDVVRDDDQPQDTSEPKTAKTPNLEWFMQPPRPPTPDPEWNKRQVVLDQPEQPWFNQMVSATKDPLTFNDLMATLIDFSKYVLNRLKIDNLTQDILLGPAYNLLKGTCSSSIELEYHFQECFNALTDKLDDRYPFDLSKPLPLQGHPSHLTIAADYFFNNDLEFLKSSDPERTYTTSITKIKAAQYEIEGIKDMVPTLWSPTKVGYDKDALKGIKHWGERRKLWHRSQLNKFSNHNVYSTKKILELYKFKEGDFVDLHLNDIEDMLLLAVQHKLFHLTDNDIVDFIVALRMFTRSLVIKKQVEDLQLGVESYQKKLNITPPQQTFPEIEFKELYTPSHKPPGVIYEDLVKQKRVMRADELYKFSDGTLKKVRDELHHRVLDFDLGYNKEMSKRKWTATDKKRSELMVELIDKQMRKGRIIQNLERLVGARELEMDYKLMTRTI
ncbi:hypothetical protein Tco_0997938 [Tanacetum coccineum]